LKRRTLIKGLGLGLSAGWLAPAALSSCSKDDPLPEVPYDGTVAIIGAGAAGMYAAELLNSKGINVVIFEASTQIGGRVKSLRNQRDYQQIFGQTTPLQFGADFPIELGAEIFWGTNSFWGSAVNDLDVPVIELPALSNIHILDNVAKTAQQWQGDADFNAVESFVNGLPNYAGPQQSVKQAASVSARAEGLLNSRAANLYGSESSRIGASLLAQDLKARKHDGRAFHPQGNPMQDILLSRVAQVVSKVQFQKAITSVNYGSDMITIRTNNGEEFQANKVIVAVPLSILKQGSLAFAPSLPSANTVAAEKFGVDACVRVVIEFKENFWGTDSTFIFGGGAFPQYLNAGAGRSETSRVLSCVAYGPAASSLSALTRDQIVERVLEELDAIYDNQASATVRTDLTNGKIISAVYDWTKDEFIKGGFSYPLPSATQDDRENLRKPVGNKVFFAGEACDTGGDAGTLSGALASAERVAQEVIDAILAQS
jgi:monoamine oxidase